MAAEPSDVIYLDHAAATPLRPEVDEAMREAAARAFANPSSLHAAGRDARRVLEDCRERILALLGGRPGGTGATGSSSPVGRPRPTSSASSAWRGVRAA